MAEPVAPPARARAGRARTTTYILLALTLFGVFVFAASGVAVWYAASYEDSGEVTSGSFLRLELSGPLREAPVPGAILADPADRAPLVTEYAAAIRKAADDERIDGLLIEIDSASGGLASWQELRTAVLAFREAGKPCVAFGESFFTNYDYYLASACDTVVMSPAGANLVAGLSLELTYYKGTLEKLGVVPEFEHVGDFKSAIEAYEREEPSDEARIAFESILDSMFEQLVQGIADGRGMDPEAVRAAVDTPAMAPQGAKDAGLVDHLAFPDQVWASAYRFNEDGWADLLSDPETRSVEETSDHYTPAKEYVKEIRAKDNDYDDRIAVVHAKGTILSGDGDSGLFGDNNLTDGKFRRWMADARTNDDVKAVVVRVDSRGGSGLASSMMWREVARTKMAGKPVVVSFADYAASGGYYMSANADWIVSQPGTLTGSIGVFGGKFALAGAYEKIGMTTTTVKRGDMADLLSFSEPFSDEGREVFRGFLADFYQQFLQTVGDGRGMSTDEVHAVAQGRVWTGVQAIEHGLVDELGGLDVALAKAAELAELEEYGLLRLPRSKSFFEVLMDDLGSGNVSAPKVDVALPVGLDMNEFEELVLLERLSHGDVAALLPGNPTIK